jgi:hypothetical protein
MKVHLTDQVRIAPDVMHQIVDSESVILDLASEQYFGLDEVGTRIWQLIAEHGCLSDVYDEILGEYDVQPEVLRRDLLELVTALAEQGLLRVERTTEGASDPGDGAG